MKYYRDTTRKFYKV